MPHGCGAFVARRLARKDVACEDEYFDLNGTPKNVFDVYLVRIDKDPQTDHAFCNQFGRSSKEYLLTVLSFQVRLSECL